MLLRGTGKRGQDGFAIPLRASSASNLAYICSSVIFEQVFDEVRRRGVSFLSTSPPFFCFVKFDEGFFKGADCFEVVFIGHSDCSNACKYSLLFSREGHGMSIVPFVISIMC